ncbi:hypothetical protein F0562_032135 [Nyssa sinensis]|uniref:Uncharacterized protein n=1 Tax=Nyssa sinensis TaxID=561372 RepID=A0A5J5AXP0_9ASTE|nr:hypothetical protein F0562_032135 [Nyssa sinensis]
MKRQAPYPDSDANVYTASQMQHMSVQRMQQNAGMINFPGRPDSFPPEQERPYIPSKAEGQWQWDRDAPKVSNPMISHLHTEGQGGNAAQSFYQGQILDQELDLKKQANKEPRLQSHEQDMEIGYEDKPSPLTFEALEQKFQDEIIKFLKEQSDAEDAENARHREKIIEINTQYQEKLSSLRARQASRREDFLRKESESRLHQYQEAGMGHHPTNMGLIDPHSYSGAAAAEAHRAYASQFESNRERHSFLGGGRSQGTEARVPYPEGRVYNKTGARHY